MTQIQKIKTYVVFLDILGFRNIMNSDDENLMRFLESMNTIQKNTYEMILKEIKDYYGENGYFDINSLSLSDSIVLWTKSADPLDCINLMGFTKSLLVSAMIEGFPLRGAMTYGDLYFSEIQDNGRSTTNVFGKAIVNAFELEKVQQWSGVIVDDICIERLRTANVEKFGNVPSTEEEATLFIKYEVPKSSGKVEEKFVINWPQGVETNDEYITYSFSRHGKASNDWSVKTKIKNTIDFYNFVNSK